MRRSIKFLIPISALLVALILWDEHQTDIENEARDSSNRVFQNYDLSKLESIKYFDSNSDNFDSEDGNSEIFFELLKRAEEWDVRSPVSEKADQRAVKQLIETLLEYKYDKRIEVESGESLKKFGLEKPKRKIALKLSDGTGVDLLIGENAPLGYSVYSKISGIDGAVFIGSQHLNTATTKTLFDFRDKKISDVKFNDVIKITVNRNDVAHVMFKSGNNWTGMNEGESKSVKGEELDPEEIEDLIVSISRLQVLKFYSIQDFPEGYLKSADSLTISWQSQTDKFLTFKSIGEKVFVIEDEVLKEVSSSFAKYFKKDLLGYKNKKLTNIKVVDVSKVVLNKVSYTKSAGKWTPQGNLESANALVIDSTELENFLYDLEFSKVKSFSKEMNALGKKMLSVTIETKAENVTQLEIYESLRNKDDYLVTSSAYSGAGEVAADLFKGVLDKL